MALFTKEISDADEPYLVENLPPLKFAGGPTNQGRKGKNQGDWDPDRSVSVIKAVGIPVDEALLEIGMNSRRAVIHLEFDCE